MLAGTGRVAGILVCLRKGVLIDSIRRLDSVGGLQILNSIGILGSSQIENTQAVVGFETARLTRDCGSKSGLSFTACAGGAWIVVRLKVKSISRQGLTGAETRIGSMPACCRPVSNTGDGELRVIGKLHRLGESGG